MNNNLEKIKELKKECIKIGVSEEKLNIDDKLIGLHINCNDHQFVKFDGEKYSFCTVGGSRYCYTETFTNAKEAAAFIYNNISEKTLNEINQEYKAILGKLNNL